MCNRRSGAIRASLMTSLIAVVSNAGGRLARNVSYSLASFAPSLEYTSGYLSMAAVTAGVSISAWNRRVVGVEANVFMARATSSSDTAGNSSTLGGMC